MTGMEELEQFTREMERLKDAMKRSRKVNLTTHPFRMGTDKEAALKPLEEAAEVFGAWQEYNAWLNLDVDDKYREDERIILADEIADCIQACCNLADRYSIDLQAAMGRCEKRNFRRGRYGAELGIEDADA